MEKEKNVLGLLNYIEEFLIGYEEQNKNYASQAVIKDINAAISIIKNKKSNIGDIPKQIDAEIKTERFKKLLKDLIDIVKKYFNGRITLLNARIALETKIYLYQDEDYNFSRELLKEQLNHIRDAIEQIPSLTSEEDIKQVNFALKEIEKLINDLKNTHHDQINVISMSSQLNGTYKDIRDEAELMKKILNTVIIKPANIIEPETLSKLVKDSTDSVLAPYKKSKTNYLTILYWILIAIVVIIGILFALGLIFGFIYAIRAERFNTKWSTKRVIGRTFLGFVFVAMYWNRYGIW